MLALGCPIVGDALYAPTPRGAERLHLHASELGFAHPRTGEWMVYESTPPFSPPPHAEARWLRCWRGLLRKYLLWLLDWLSLCWHGSGLY